MHAGVVRIRKYGGSRTNGHVPNLAPCMHRPVLMSADLREALERTAQAVMRAHESA